MKLFHFLAVFIGLSISMVALAQDDVYDYQPNTPTQTTTTTTTEGGNTYITNNNYYDTDGGGFDDDEYDYYYSSRIRRFHNPVMGCSYYSGYYVDQYWYNPDPFLWGQTIYYNPYSPVMVMYQPWWSWWRPRPIVQVNYWNGGWGWNNYYSSWNNGWGWNNYYGGWNNYYNSGYNPWNNGWGYGNWQNVVVNNYYSGPYYNGDSDNSYGGHQGPRPGKDSYGGRSSGGADVGIYNTNYNNGGGVRPNPHNTDAQGGKNDNGVGIGNTVRPSKNTNVSPFQQNDNNGTTPIKTVRPNQNNNNDMDNSNNFDPADNTNNNNSGSDRPKPKKGSVVFDQQTEMNNNSQPVKNQSQYQGDYEKPKKGGHDSAPVMEQPKKDKDRDHSPSIDKPRQDKQPKSYNSGGGSSKSYSSPAPNRNSNNSQPSRNSNSNSNNGGSSRKPR